MQYNRALEKKNNAENISRVLYPNDSGPLGKTLRLKQQYFFKDADIVIADHKDSWAFVMETKENGQKELDRMTKAINAFIAGAVADHGVRVGKHTYIERSSFNIVMIFLLMLGLAIFVADILITVS
jgi:hypothetical protein